MKSFTLSISLLLGTALTAAAFPSTFENEDLFPRDLDLDFSNLEIRDVDDYIDLDARDFDLEDRSLEYSAHLLRIRDLLNSLDLEPYLLYLFPTSSLPFPPHFILATDHRLTVVAETAPAVPVAAGQTPLRRSTKCRSCPPVVDRASAPSTRLMVVAAPGPDLLRGGSQRPRCRDRPLRTDLRASSQLGEVEGQDLAGRNPLSSSDWTRESRCWSGCDTKSGGGGDIIIYGVYGMDKV